MADAMRERLYALVEAWDAEGRKPATTQSYEEPAYYAGLSQAADELRRLLEEIPEVRRVRYRCLKDEQRFEGTEQEAWAWIEAGHLNHELTAAVQFDPTPAWSAWSEWFRPQHPSDSRTKEGG